MPRNELYIGNLNRDVTSKDIESVFKRHGKILRCDIKNRGYGPVYAFIEYDDERDAEDAIHAENGKELLGSSMLVEFTKGRGAKRGRGGDDRGGYGRNGFSGGRSLDCYECGRPGHFARDCPRRRGGGGRDRSRSRSRSRDRRRDRSRSRDRKRRDRTRSRSRSRNRDRSRNGDRSRSRDRSRDRSRERSRHTKSKEKRVSKSRSPTRSRTRSPRSARSAARSATPRSRASRSHSNDRHNGSHNGDTRNGDINDSNEVNMD